MRCEVTSFPAVGEAAGGADIYCGKGLVVALGDFLQELSGGGRVLVVRDGDGEKLAAEIAESLRCDGFRVTELRAEDADLAEENCIVSVGAGGFAAAAAAKKAAADRRGECVLFPSVPCEEGLLAGGGVRAVCLDEDVLAASPADATAAACGILLSSPVKRFEDLFAEKVLAAPKRDFRREELAEGDTLTEIAVKVMKNGLGGTVYACDAVAEMMRLIALSRRKRPRRKGEYVFVAACTLAAFYKAYLSSPALDTLLPADHSAAADEIARLAGADRCNILQAFDIFGANSYFRISYILGEYRMDLISELACCDLSSAERKWRRMYDDAGFWMKSAFTSEDVLRALALAGEMSGGLLGFAAGTGLTAAMLPGVTRTEKREKAAKSG